MWQRKVNRGQGVGSNDAQSFVAQSFVNRIAFLCRGCTLGFRCFPAGLDVSEGSA